MSKYPILAVEVVEGEVENCVVAKVTRIPTLMKLVAMTGAKLTAWNSR